MRRLVLAATIALAACGAPPAADEDAGDPLSLYLQARVARASGEVARAAIMLERAYALAPDVAPVAAALGEARFLLGQDALARAALEHAVALDPEEVRASVLLARLDVREHQPAAALARLLALDERRPAELDVLELLHPLLLWSGETQRGLELFTRTVELAPDLALAHEALGDFQACVGRLDDALASYRRALELDPRRRGAELKAAHVLERQADSLLRRLAPPAGAGIVVPAAEDAAPGSR